mmetsp:Transcript_6170/g.22675  ORF Transcript_6170/g.22675 Transcript_6170/m.22675 type:complete len:274 (+) Transcript_6170:4655-5476(+)
MVLLLAVVRATSSEQSVRSEQPCRSQERRRRKQGGLCAAAARRHRCCCHATNGHARRSCRSCGCRHCWLLYGALLGVDGGVGACRRELRRCGLWRHNRRRGRRLSSRSGSDSCRSSISWRLRRCPRCRCRWWSGTEVAKVPELLFWRLAPRLGALRCRCQRAQVKRLRLRADILDAVQLDARRALVVDRRESRTEAENALLRVKLGERMEQLALVCGHDEQRVTPRVRHEQQDVVPVLHRHGLREEDVRGTRHELIEHDDGLLHCQLAIDRGE